MIYTVTEDTKVTLNGQKYILEKGDKITINEKDYSTKERKELPDSDFAYVKGEGKGKVRKYIINDKEHVQAAIAYAKKYKDEEAKAAWPKIKAAAEKYDIDAGNLED